MLTSFLKDETSKNFKLGMEYDHYEAIIIKEYGVKLVGWPDGVDFASPYALNAADVVTSGKRA